MKRLNKGKEARRIARLALKGAPSQHTRVIQDQRRRPLKHKKPLQGDEND